MVVDDEREATRISGERAGANHAFRGIAVTNERNATLAILLVLIQRAANPSEHRAIEDWIAAREDDECGFLWLSARLNIRPSILERRVRMMLTATKREHTKLQRNIETAQKRYGD